MRCDASSRSLDFTAVVLVDSAMFIHLVPFPQPDFSCSFRLAVPF